MTKVQKKEKIIFILTVLHLNCICKYTKVTILFVSSHFKPVGWRVKVTRIKLFNSNVTNHPAYILLSNTQQLGY